MAKKNNLSFTTRLWLCVFFVIIVCVAGVIVGMYSAMNPFERGLIVAAVIVTTGMVISTAIISKTIHTVFGKNEGNDSRNEH